LRAKTVVDGCGELSTFNLSLYQCLTTMGF
jgi:hypothetical protein